MAVRIKELNQQIKITKSREVFVELKSKRFTIMPDCLIRALNRELTASAKAIYIHIYGMAEKQFNQNKQDLPVVISVQALNENCLFKSERTVRRRLAELRKKDFILCMEMHNQYGAQTSNAIWPLIPQSILPSLRSANDRKTIVTFQKSNRNETTSIETIVPLSCSAFIDSTINKTMAPDHDVASNTNIVDIKDETSKIIPVDVEQLSNNDPVVIEKSAPLNSGAVSDVPINKIAGERASVDPNEQNYITKNPSNLATVSAEPEQAAYNAYNIAVLNNETLGLNKPKAHRMAYQQLDPIFKLHLNKYLEKQKLIEQQQTIVTLSQITAPAKNGIHKIYNNIVNNNNISKSGNIKSDCYTRIYQNVVNLNKKITAEMVGAEIIKIQDQIPLQIFKEGRTIQDIIVEVQFHVKHRDPNKTKTDLHALNAAKKLLKSGQWGRPKKIIYLQILESIEREKEAAKEKQLELQQIRRFIKNNF